MPFNRPHQRIVLDTQLDARYVLDPHHTAACILTYDDIAKLFRCNQPALCLHRIGEFLARRSRFATDLSGRIHRILRIDRTDYVGHRDAELGQHIGFEPDAHGVLSRTENLHAGNSRKASDGIVEVNVSVVREELGIISALGRIERHQDQRSGGGLLHRYAILRNTRWKLR